MLENRQIDLKCCDGIGCLSLFRARNLALVLWSLRTLVGCSFAVGRVRDEFSVVFLGVLMFKCIKNVKDGINSQSGLHFLDQRSKLD